MEPKHRWRTWSPGGLLSERRAPLLAKVKDSRMGICIGASVPLPTAIHGATAGKWVVKVWEVILPLGDHLLRDGKEEKGH